ncbi:hypothetical protein QQX98_011891 [Neonectria punicea]|uniref:Uncharacterized protein n=1 Tax=Neonectria punicea TaxID=979145 RepID=A0ABR1GKE4_9HYPO
MQPTIALPLDSFLAALDLNDAFASMAQDSMSVDAYIRQRIALQARTQNLIGRIGSCNASSPDDLAVRFIVDQLTYDKDVVSLVPSRLPDDEKALLRSHKFMANPNRLDSPGSRPSQAIRRPFPDGLPETCASFTELLHSDTPQRVRSPQDFPSS